MIAKKLIANQVEDPSRVEDVLTFLCSESGSHDYTIYRQEARDNLGLNIERPDDTLYKLLKQIHDDIADELKLSTPFDPSIALAGSPNRNYVHRRALLESVDGGNHVYISEGTLKMTSVQTGPGVVQNAVHDERKSEGWQHE